MAVHGDADVFDSVVLDDGPSMRRFVALVATNTGQGLWLLDESGRILAFGDALQPEPVPGEHLSFVAMTATPSGNGLWLLDKAGGVVAFGDAAPLELEPGSRRSGVSFVSLAATPSGDGVWLLAEDGRVEALGDAPSVDNTQLDRDQLVKFVGIAASPSGEGLWLLDRDGQVFAFGDAQPIAGQPPGDRSAQRFRAMAAMPAGDGLLLLSDTGASYVGNEESAHGLLTDDANPRPHQRSGKLSSRLPTFLVIGASHAGTTSLWRHLRSHPDVFMPDLKEPSFFAIDERYEGGLEWYRGLFEDAGNASAVGEASVWYTDVGKHPHTAERIAQLIPDAKLIYLLRHPIERLIGKYHFYASRFGLRDPIDEVLQDEDFIAGSLYCHQVDHYLKYFHRRQILILFAEELHRDPATTISSAFDFIGVESSWLPPDLSERVNRRDDVRYFHALERPGDIDPRSQQLSEQAHRGLVLRLRPDLERLRVHLDPAFECWSLLD